jgi:hypothetical protein
MGHGNVHDHVALVEQPGIVTGLQPHAGVRPDLREQQDLIGGGLPRGDHRLQRVVVDLDQLGGVDRPRLLVGHQRDHRLADVADHAVGQPGPQHALVVHWQRGRGLQAEVVGGDHREHSGGCPGGADVDRSDPGMGDGGVDEDHLGGAGQAEVGDVAALPGDQRPVLRP